MRRAVAADAFFDLPRLGASVSAEAADATRLRVTISLGVATTEKPASSAPDELVRRADAALYEAKTGGKDRVVVAPAAGEPAA